VVSGVVRGVSVTTLGQDLAVAVIGLYVRHQVVLIREWSELGSAQQGQYGQHFAKVRAVGYRWRRSMEAGLVERS